MARRTKAAKFDIEVEAALEEALDFDFDNDALDAKLMAGENGTEIVSQDSSRVEARRKARYSGIGAFPESHLSVDEEKAAELLDIESLEQQIVLATEDLKKIQTTSFPAEKSAGSIVVNGDFSRSAISAFSDIQDYIGGEKNAGNKPSIAIGPVNSIDPSPRLEFNEPPNAGGGDGSGPSTQLSIVKKIGKKVRSRFFKDPLYWSTTALSAMWAMGGIAFAYKFSSSNSIEGLRYFLSSAQGMLVLAGTVVPILMFWGFAQLTRRTKELQQMVNTMTGAAMRLLEPETTSKERVASLGHTIRREVMAMGEGIDRTMSRASELEALLQGEVNNLEQAYSENEARIRMLIVELANEREAVSTHADHVKAKITGAKDQLTHEFNSIADHINATAESFTIMLSETLNARWGELVNEFSKANEGVTQQLSQKFIETVQSFDTSRGRFFEELDTRFAQIDQHTEEASKVVAGRLGAKMDDFVKIVHERTEDVEEHFNVLTGRLASSGKKIIEAVDESVAEIERRSDDIDQRLRSTADRVLNDFDDKFQTLDDAIIDRGNQSLTGFGEQITRLENRANDLPLVFDNVAETAVDEFARQIKRVEEQFSQISGHLSKNGTVLAEILTNSLNEIEERSNDVDKRLNTSAGKVLDAFETRFRKLDNTFISRSSHSLSEFSTQVEKLEEYAEKLEGYAKNTTAGFDATAREVLDAFETRFDKLDNTFIDRSNHSLSEFNAQVEKLEEHVKSTATSFDAVASEVLDAFETRFYKLDNTFIDRSNHSLSEFSIQVEKLEEHAKSMATSFDTATSLAVQAFEKRLNQVDDSLNQRSTSLIQSFISRTEALEESTDKLNTALEMHVVRVNEAFQSRTRDIVETLTGGRNDILSIIDETKVRLSDEMEIVGTTIGKLVDERAGGFIHQFIEGREKLSSTLETETARIITTVSQQVNMLSRYVSDMENILLERLTALDEQARKHVENLDKKTVTFEKTVVDSFNTAREVIETQARSIDTRVDTLCDSLSLNSEILNKVLGDQANVLEERITRIRTVIADSNVSLTEAMSRHVSVFQESIHSNDEALREIFTDHLKNLEGQTARLKDNQTFLLQSLDNRIDVFQDSLVNSQLTIETVLSDHGLIVSNRAVELQNSLIQTLSAVDEKLEHQSKLLDKRAYELRDAVDYNSTVLEDSFLRQTAVIDERTKTMQKAIEIGATNVRSVLEDNALTLSKTLRERISEVSGILSNETHQAETVISSATVRLMDSVVDAVNNVDQKLAERALFLTDNISQAGEQLNIGMTNIEARITGIASFLSEEASKAGGIISDAGMKLSGSVVHAAKEADRAFSDRASALQENIKSVESQINAGIGVIENRMFEAAKEVEQKLSDRSFFLKENILQIEDLIGSGINSIEGRISEITQSTAQHLINQTENLHSLTEQLKSAATKTSDSLGEMTNQFSDQLKEVAQAAEDRAWSSTAQLQSSLSGLINDAAGKFEGATEEIRKSTEEIREELSRTRNDLSHSVSTLPVQTKEYTDAMRKVVMEQIEALKELSGIVEESGRLFDVSQPVNNSNPATMLKQRTQRSSTNKPAPPIFSPTAATGATNVSQDSFSRSASRATQSRGWVSDLLARASKDDMDRSPAAGIRAQQTENSAETLNSMSADIVQAIDRNAIIQLWQHYRRGQRNISPSRLYTVDGHQTFEKIKHKYAIDGGFRRAVSQYITDFERLLGDVTRNGGNNNTVREYLTSDTGKVYTMLAHVSGRIQ